MEKNKNKKCAKKGRGQTLFYTAVYREDNHVVCNVVSYTIVLHLEHKNIHQSYVLFYSEAKSSP